MDPYDTPAAAPEPAVADSYPEPPPQLNPFVYAWLRPRATFRSFEHHGSAEALYGLLYVTLLPNYVGNDNLVRLLVNNGVVAYLFAVVFVTMVASLIAWGVYPLLLQVACRWLDGVAEAADLRVAVGVGTVPLLGSMLSTISLLTLLGPERLANPDAYEYTMTEGLVAFAASLMIVAFALWAIINTSKTLSEANGFSSWMGFWAQLLALAIVVVPLLVIVFIGAVLAMM